ncbi:Uncharacterised protein [Burkholderia pseudomallei]|nr:Uncharacterised protein [Burkholderia pseudomallei]CAK1293767.1 Uncharacterised protein [Burkholderia pseudomallei]CAK1295435.1 Uncharacterised protein [Burkholderia pseudomallei]CAK1296369.1 Uncharacterised protein [Burkholderia pseudomallei]CAK1303381.1 Uncharacterised protein [Burkholderia pseudomallei]
MSHLYASRQILDGSHGDGWGEPYAYTPAHIN